MIDFWGPGFEVAERMNLVGELGARSYSIEQLRLVGSAGKSFATLDVKALDDLLHGRFFSLLRADLAGVLFRHIQNDVEIRFEIVSHRVV